MIKNVTDLEVYQEAMSLEIQAKRAAKSVTANLAEGFAKRFSEREFKRFLMIAIGSNDEVISHLRTLSIVVPRLNQESLSLLEEYKVLSKRLNTLHKNWHFAGTPIH